MAIYVDNLLSAIANLCSLCASGNCMGDVRDSSQGQIVLQYLQYFDWFLLDFIAFCTMSQHYESDSPNSSTNSTSGMSSDISEDESVLGSEDLTREKMQKCQTMCWIMASL